MTNSYKRLTASETPRFPRKLQELSQSGHDLFIGRSLGVVHLDKFPPNCSLTIDHVGSGMRPTATIRIENAIAIYDLVILVLEQRKVEFGAWEPLLEFLDELLRKLMAVNANRQNLDPLLLFFSQKAFQLPELLRAVGSPVAAVKYQDDVLLASKVREGYSLPIHILKRKVRDLLSDFNPIKVRRF